MQAYIGYRGNSQWLFDDATAFVFGMQMAHRTFDENFVRQISDPRETETDHMVANV